MLSDKQAGIINILETYGELRLRDYIKIFNENQAPPLQPREDLITVAHDYAGRLLGEKTAEALRRRLEEVPVILTANHHGVDYLPMYVQGSLIYALANAADAARSRTETTVFPVFAYGSVSLNNPTYPRGILLARRRSSPASPETTGRREEAPSLRINIFPDSVKHLMVSAAPPFSREMVERACGQVERFYREGAISQIEYTALRLILGEEYSREQVLSQANYSDQAVILNHRLWKRFFNETLRPDMPDMVYLEMEKIVAELLPADLARQHTLTYAVLFDAFLREAVLEKLDGRNGCWQRRHLLALREGELDSTRRRELGRLSGTVFFWGVDDKGRRVHLDLIREQGRDYLQGRDDSGKLHRVAYTPEGISEALGARRILPSLFTTFLMVSFARGFRCFGGPWQTTYLPEMQQGLLQALQATPGYSGWVNICAKVRTANYVAGMIVAVACYPEGMSAAGPVELLARGGLSAPDLEKIGDMTVEEAICLGDNRGIQAVPAIIAHYYGERLLQMEF